MKQFVIIMSALLIVNFGMAQKHAMTNHTDVRIPPARPVRPVMTNNIDDRKIPVMRIEKETNTNDELELENDYSLSDKISVNRADAVITSNGSYRISKGEYNFNVSYKIDKSVSINLDNAVVSSKVITQKNEIEVDGKSFNSSLSKFNGNENDDIGYQISVPKNIGIGGEWNAATEINGRTFSNSYRIISMNDDHAVIKINYITTSVNEEKHSEGLIAVDNATGMITAKNIRISTSGNITVKGKQFEFESYSTLKMGLD